jgi:hypothetical protein
MDDRHSSTWVTTAIPHRRTRCPSVKAIAITIQIANPACFAFNVALIHNFPSPVARERLIPKMQWIIATTRPTRPMDRLDPHYCHHRRKNQTWHPRRRVPTRHQQPSHPVPSALRCKRVPSRLPQRHRQLDALRIPYRDQRHLFRFQCKLLLVLRPLQKSRPASRNPWWLRYTSQHLSVGLNAHPPQHLQPVDLNAHLQQHLQQRQS